MTNDKITWCTLYDTLYNIRYANPDATSTPHWHTTFELYFFTCGSGKHIINNVESPFSAGSIYIISPNDIHSVVIDEGVRANSLKMNFSNAFYFYYLNPICRFDKFPVTANLSGDDFKCAMFIAEMLVEHSKMDESPIRDELCLDAMEQLMVLIARNTSQPKEEEDSDKLKDALTYIHNNFHNPLKIGDIARAVSYSSNYLSSQFSKKLGISIRDYLQDLRLFYAKDLIKYSSFSISEICYRSGFQSMAYFSKAFKNRFSESPNSFRNSHSVVKPLDEIQ